MPSFRAVLATGDSLPIGKGISKRYDLSGIRLDGYRKNPVLLWAHDMGQLLGKVDGLRFEGRNLVGVLHVDDGSMLGKEKCRQIARGLLRHVSIGVDGLEFKQDAKELAVISAKGGEVDIVGCSLVEVSLVSVPRNLTTLLLTQHTPIINMQNTY